LIGITGVSQPIIAANNSGIESNGKKCSCLVSEGTPSSASATTASAAILVEKLRMLLVIVIRAQTVTFTAF
jgi:hypothetical protein